MALKNSQYYAIMRKYERTRLKNHDIQTARYNEIYERLPEYKSLDDSISILSVQYGKKLLKYVAETNPETDDLADNSQTAEAEA